MSYLLYLIKNSLVSLLGNCSLTRITKTPFGNKKLLKNILKVKLTAPTPALCKRHRDRVAIVNLSKLICICGINHVTAKHTGEGITSKHSTLTCATSCDYKVTRTGVKQYCRKNTDLHVGKLLLILCRIHTVVKYLMTEGFYNRAKSRLNKSILSRLAIFIYKSNFH